MRSAFTISNRSFFLIILLFNVICSSSGCFAHSLHQQYAEQALGAHSVLRKGASQSDVTKVLGNPRTRNIDNGKTVHTFLVPNDTWSEGYYSGGSADSSSTSVGRPGTGGVPDPQAMLGLIMIALAVELVVDPVLTCVYMYQNRDATKCEYKVTYDKSACVENLEVNYPQGFAPNACASWITTPK